MNEKVYLSDDKANEIYEKLQQSVDANLKDALDSLKDVILSEVYSVLKSWTVQDAEPDLVKSDIKQSPILDNPV